MKAALAVALARATRLQACIGFWTINPTLLGADLARTLADEHGFVCLNLHPSTDVDMKAIAEPFDVAKVDVYKQLQRKMTNGLTPVMELRAEDGASASNTTITVFGTDRKDLTKPGTVGREIHVALLDPKTHVQSLYPATTLQSSCWPGLSPRRAAFRSRPAVRQPEGAAATRAAAAGGGGR